LTPVQPGPQNEPLDGGAAERCHRVDAGRGEAEHGPRRPPIRKRPILTEASVTVSVVWLSAPFTVAVRVLLLLVWLKRSDVGGVGRGGHEHSGSGEKECLHFCFPCAMIVRCLGICPSC
jgi:hypothetical protein